MLEQHMQKLASEIGVKTTFATDKEGEWSFPLEEGVFVKILQTPSGFSFSSEVAPCPSIKEEEFLTQMLLGNLFGKGTLGATLGLTPDGKQVLLSMNVDHMADYKEFRDLLEDFLNSADFWREESLRAGTPGSEKKESAR